MRTKMEKGAWKIRYPGPVSGTWHAHAETQQGKVHCVRSFQKVLGGSYIELIALWHMGDTVYEEWCFFGCDREGKLRFWSFTSDGKQSNGELTDTTDIHPEAIGFVAQMPAGVARQVYWPDEALGFHRAVESQTKKGWNRFVEHHYVPETQSVTSLE